MAPLASELLKRRSQNLNKNNYIRARRVGEDDMVEAIIATASLVCVRPLSLKRKIYRFIYAKECIYSAVMEMEADLKV